jgi:hypothetical protein
LVHLDLNRRQTHPAGHRGAEVKEVIRYWLKVIGEDSSPEALSRLTNNF